LLSPLTSQEAVLSSRIEGTQATLGDVLRCEAGEEPAGIEKRIDIQEILNYRSALREAERSLHAKPFTLNLLLRLHEILLNSVRGKNMARGQFRGIQNWIGAKGTPIEMAAFVPPSPLVLMEYLDNWEKYYHETLPDPLVQLAVIHAQFEILHPFLDGNGRLGRIVIPLFLFERKLLSLPMFYLSEWLEEHREEYVIALRNLGREDRAWNRWIEFFLTGVEEQAVRNSKKARVVVDLYERTKKDVIGLTRSQFAVPILDQLFDRPIFQSTHLKFVGGVSKATIAKLLRTLEETKMLKVIRAGSGRRAAVYAFTELINICEGRTVI
jgi:Fic family protein